MLVIVMYRVFVLLLRFMLFYQFIFLGFFVREEGRSELWEILQPELSQDWFTELYQQRPNSIRTED